HGRERHRVRTVQRGHGGRTADRRPAHRCLRRPDSRTGRSSSRHGRTHPRRHREQHPTGADGLGGLRTRPVHHRPLAHHRGRRRRRPGRGHGHRHRLPRPPRRTGPHRRPGQRHHPAHGPAAARPPRSRRRRPRPPRPGEHPPLRPTTAYAGLDAVILDYNGVIGLQPTTDQWLRLARTALWPEDDLPAFQHAFWTARTAYDAGHLSDLAYWATVLGHHPGARRLRGLRDADTAMWTSIDDHVIDVLHQAYESGLPLVLLSNAPRHLSDVLDRRPWRRLMTHAFYSARLQVCKPDPAA